MESIGHPHRVCARVTDQPPGVLDSGESVVTKCGYLVVRATSSGHSAPRLWCDSFGCSICSGDRRL